MVILGFCLFFILGCFCGFFSCFEVHLRRCSGITFGGFQRTICGVLG